MIFNPTAGSANYFIVVAFVIGVLLAIWFYGKAYGCALTFFGLYPDIASVRIYDCFAKIQT